MRQGVREAEGDELHHLAWPPVSGFFSGLPDLFVWMREFGHKERRHGGRATMSAALPFFSPGWLVPVKKIAGPQPGFQEEAVPL